jgi:hypothetical protein
MKIIKTAKFKGKNILDKVELVKDRCDCKYDAKELEKGMKVEMEHTSDPDMAKEVAKDHLDEFPNYYEALNKMEKGLKRKDTQKD